MLMLIPAQPVYSLEPSIKIRIDSTTKEFKDPAKFVLIVEIYNMTGEGLVIFPAYINRSFKPLDGQDSHFNPYPGPAVDPWLTAILIDAGERKTIKMRGLKKHGVGFWVLEHGNYNLSVTMHVAPTSIFGVETRKGKFRNSIIWRGTAESNSIKIRYSD